MLESTSARFGAAIGVALLLGVLVGLAVHLSARTRSGSAPAFGLPLFHGEGEWAPGRRPAPEFALRDQRGRVISPASERGRPLVIAFLSAAPRSHTEREALTLGEAEALVPPARAPLIDVVSLDPARDTPALIARAVARWHLGLRYRWLTGPRPALEQVLRSYNVHRRPAAVGGDSSSGTPIYLVDRAGFERAGYLYPFAPTVLANDMRRLDRLGG